MPDGLDAGALKAGDPRGLRGSVSKNCMNF